jgi:TonB family protein
MSIWRILTLTFALVCASLAANASAEGQDTAASQRTPGTSASPPASPSPAGPADSTRLEVIKAPRPVYPEQAAEKALQGEVWIKLLISESGDVETTEIESGNPILAKAAADAMKKWKFKPFIKNGRAVKVSTKLPFDFAMAGRVFDTPSKPAAHSPVSEVPATSAASDPSTPSPDNTKLPQKLRVAQGVMEGQLLHRVEPVYPPEARRNHIQGTVLLQATIGKDGRIHGVKAVAGPKELIEASIGAIEQWRYRPYLLEGEPVEVETTIKIEFRM